MEAAARFTDLPSRLKRLPVDARGFPVPWFVEWIDGKPDFRIIARGAFQRAMGRRLCWICGQPLLSTLTFVVGPMCVINRISSEPPCHMECGRFAATGCPFLTTPAAVRREAGLPEQIEAPVGDHIEHNPGATAVYMTMGCKTFYARPGDRQPLVEMKAPKRVEWYAKGRRATRAEVLAAIDKGLPLLLAEAENHPEREAALRQLKTGLERTLQLVPDL